MKPIVFFALIAFLACSNVASQQQQDSPRPPVTLSVPADYRTVIADNVKEILMLQEQLREKQNELNAFIKVLQSTKKDSIPEGYQFAGFSEDMTLVQFAEVPQKQ